MIFEFVEGASLQDAVTIPTLMIAIAGLLVVQAHHREEVEQQRSRFYLDSVLAGYQSAYDLLEDGNNNNKLWVAAARAIRDTNALSRKIIIKEHQEVLEIHNITFRRLFHDLLIDKRAAFFYGVGDRTLTLQQAEEQSHVVDGSNYLSTELKEESVYTVWKAAQWPSEDSIQGRFSNDERRQPIFRYHYLGLAEYLNYKRKDGI